MSNQSNTRQIVLELVENHSPNRLDEVREALDRAGSSQHVSCLLLDHHDTDPSFRFTKADDADLHYVCSCGSGGLVWFVRKFFGWSSTKAAAEIRTVQDRLGIVALTDDEIEEINRAKEQNKEARQSEQIGEIEEILSKSTRPAEDYLSERLGHSVPSDLIDALPLKGRPNLTLKTIDNQDLVSRALDVVLVDETGKTVGLQTVWLDRNEPKKLDIPYTTLGKKTETYASFGTYEPKKPIALTEGELDGLAVFLATGMHTRAACGAGNLSKVPVPDDVAYVVTVPDTDEAGLKAADETARILHGRDTPVLRAKLPRSTKPTPTFDTQAIQNKYASLSRKVAKQTYLNDYDLHDLLSRMSPDDQDAVVNLLSAYDVPKSLVRSKITQVGAAKVDALDVYHDLGPEKLKECIDTASEDIPSDELARTDSDPLRLAQLVLRRHPHLRHWAETWYEYRAEVGVYVEIIDVDLRQTLTAIIDDDFGRRYQAREKAYEEGRIKTCPVRSAVTNLLQANVISRLKEIVGLSSELNTPFWLKRQPDDPDPQDLRVDSKGYWVFSSLLTDKPIRIESTPRLFAVSALFEIDPANRVGLSADSQAFLDSLKLGQDGIESLRDCLGLPMVPRQKRPQKAILFQGAQRSGKGTLLGILQNLYAGYDSRRDLTADVRSTKDLALSGVISLDTRDFTREHGLTNLRGAQIGILWDTRFNNIDETDVLVERLLRLTSSEPITINPKNKPTYNIVPEISLYVASNDLPKLVDRSKAASNRFVAIKFRESFLGKEDSELIRRVKADLQGWFWFAFEGYEQVSRTGQIRESEDGRQVVADMGRSGSPLSTFIEEYCDVGEGYEADVDEVYKQYEEYQKDQGGSVKSYSKQNFRTSVKDVAPTVRVTRPDGEGPRPFVFAGLKLKTTKTAYSVRRLCEIFFTSLRDKQSRDYALSQLEQTEIGGHVSGWRDLLAGLDDARQVSVTIPSAVRHVSVTPDNPSQEQTGSDFTEESQIDRHAPVTPLDFTEVFTEFRVMLGYDFNLNIEGTKKLYTFSNFAPNPAGREKESINESLSIETKADPQDFSQHVYLNRFTSLLRRDGNVTEHDGDVTVNLRLMNMPFDAIETIHDDPAEALVRLELLSSDSDQDDSDPEDSGPGPDQPDRLSPSPFDGYELLNLCPEDGSDDYTYDRFENALRVTGKTCKLAESVDEVRDFLKTAKGRLLSLDFETHALSGSAESLVGINLALDPWYGLYVPIDHDPKHNLPRQPILDLLFEVVRDEVTTLLVYNASFERKVLASLGCPVRHYYSDRLKMVDCAIVRRLFDSEAERWGLKEAVRELLAFPMWSPFKEAKTKKDKGIEDFSKLDIGRSVAYGAADAILTLELYQWLLHHTEDLQSTIELEHRVADALEGFGTIKIDVSLLREELEQLVASREQVKQEAYLIAGKIKGLDDPVEFNIDSSPQIARLFESGGYAVPTTEKGNPSVDKHVLAQAASNGTGNVQILAAHILKARATSTQIEFVEKTISAVDSTGHVRPYFDSFGAETGRFSSKGHDGYADMNFQNLPKKGRSRESFTADPGYVLLDADFKGQELRVLAQITGEPSWVEALQDRNADLHKQVADQLGIDRDTAKQVNFLTAYGGSEYRLSTLIDHSKEECKEIIKKWLEAAPSIRSWVNSQISDIRRQCHTFNRVLEILESPDAQATYDVESIKGSYWRDRPTIQTAFGRKRTIAGLWCNANGFKDWGSIERKTINSPIQGTAGDLMKMSIVNVLDWIDETNLHDDFKVLLTIHDELVVQVRQDRVEELKDEFVERMTLRKGRYVVDWKVPLFVDLGVGQNWAEAKGK